MFYNKKIFHRCFCYPKRYWYKNLVQIPRYFREIHYLIKHGYDCSAVWDNYEWFIDSMRGIWTTYKEKHYGFGIIDDSLDSDENEKLWEDMIDKLLFLLDKMDEDKFINGESSYNAMNEAKDEFFKLYSKYFYYLWD